MEWDYIRWRNMFCYGNGTQEIDFRGLDADLWQIVGKNGTGKSSMIKLMKILVYREFDGYTVGEVANDINGRGFVEGQCRSNGHEWRIVAEFKPNKLFVYKDGSDTPEDWGGIGETAEMIRKEVADIPYHIFNNAISLSINDFKSFLKMTPKDGRNIRDRIFGFTIVNEMVELLKLNLNKAVSDESEMSAKMESIRESLESSQAELDDLTAKLQEENSEKVKELEEKKKKLDGELNTLGEDKKKLESDISQLKKSAKWLGNEIQKKKLQALEESLSGLQNAKNAANMKLTDAKSKQTKMRDEKALMAAKKAFEEIEKLEKDLNECTSRLGKLTTERDELKSIVDDLEKKISQASEYLSIENDAAELNRIAAEIVGAQSRISTHYAEIEKATKYLEEVEKKETEGQKLLDDNQKIIDDCNKKLELFDMGKCPECESNLEEQGDRKTQYQADLSLAKEKKTKYEGIMKSISLNKSKAENSKSAKTESAKTDIKLVQDLKSEVTPLHSALADVKDLVIGFIDTTPKVVDGKVVVMDMELYESRLKDMMDGLTKPENLDEDKKKFEEKKKKLDELNEEISTNETNKTSRESGIEVLKKHTEDTDKDVLEQTTFMYGSETEYDEKIEAQKSTVSAADTELSKKADELRDLEHKIEQTKEGIVPDETFKDVVELKGDTLEEQNVNLDASAKVLEEKLGDINAKEKELTDDVTRIGVQIDEITGGESFKNQLSSVQNIVKGFKSQIEEKEKELEKYDKQISYYKMLNHILSDEGIKAYILKDIIPSINNEISNILSLLNVPLTVVFDEEFKVHIYRFGKEVGLKTISTGQTKMADCAILLSITKILIQKYPSCNVIFYDEVFSSIDSDNRITLLEIFKAVCCDLLGLQTLIMNHDYMPSNYFGYVLPITYKDNFSSMTTMTPDQYEARVGMMDEITDVEEITFET